MALTSSIQSQIAFKNVSGKSQTDSSKSLLEEPFGFAFTIPSTNIFMDQLPMTSSVAVSQGLAVGVSASLIILPGTNNRAYQTFWPTSPPSGLDPKTGKTFSYGVGSLQNIYNGDRMQNLISDSYGISYQAVPYDSSNNRIYPLSYRDWIYQYSSGIYYQNENNISGTPSRIDIYAYIGAKLSDLSEKSLENIRISATGINSYYATYSTPTISTYSSNYLYLVDFNRTNTSGTVSLNINNLGTVSVVKYVNGTLTNMTAGDIIGGTSSKVGQIYYLLYRDGQFEYYNTYPVSDSNKYTNPSDVENSVSGIEVGTNFSNVSFVDVLSQLIYPEQQGQIMSLTCSGPTSSILSQKYDVGASFSIHGTFTFSFTLVNPTKFSANTLKIQETSYSTPFTQSTSFSGNQATFRFPTGYTNYIKTTPGGIKLRLSIAKSDRITVSETYPIDWMWRIYYGSSTSSTLSDTEIAALDSILATNSIGYFTMSGNGYKYLAVPNETGYDFQNILFRGMPLALTGTSSGFTQSINDMNFMYVTVSNTYGYSKQYRVFRTENKITTTMSVYITN